MTTVGEDLVARLPCLVYDLEKHFQVLLDYCNTLEASTYPSYHPKEALHSIRYILERLLQDFQEDTDIWKHAENLEKLAQGVVSDKAKYTTMIGLISSYLREIRNSRFAIAAPFSLPLFDMKARYLVAAYKDGCCNYVEQEKWLPVLKYTGDNSTIIAQQDFITRPIFSGLEADPRRTTIPFEFDEGNILFISADNRGSAPRVEWYMFFRFPLLEHHSATAFPLFYHEFAHLLLRISETKPRYPSKSQRTFCSFAHDSNGELTAEVKSAIILNWEEEALADMLATRIVGPAYLLALVEYASRAIGEQPSSTHPSMRFRFKLSLRELQRLNYDTDDITQLENVEEFVCAAQHARSKKSASEDASLDAIAKLEKGFENSLLSREQTELDRDVDIYMHEAEIKGIFHPFSLDCLQTSISMAEKVCTQLVPPTAIYDAGMSEEIDVIAVLNVPGILYRRGFGEEDMLGIEIIRQKLEHLAEGSVEFNADEAISRLVRKSLETAHIKSMVTEWEAMS